MRDNVGNADLLAGILSAAYGESRFPSPYWPDGFARMETMLDDVLPGTTDQFRAVAATLPAVWERLDPRINPAWVRAFADYLLLPISEDAPAPGGPEMAAP
jgi:hypothetical protein